MKFGTPISLSAAALVLSLLATSSASAVAPPGPADPQSAPAVPDASARRLQTEAEAISTDAKASGQTDAQTKWGEQFDRLASQVFDEYPDDFSFAEVVRPGSARVGFIGEAPPEAKKALGQLEGVRIVENTGFTELGVNEDVQRVLELARKQAMDVGNGYASVDVSLKIIEVGFDDVNATEKSQSDAYMRSLAAQIEKAASTLDLQSGFSVTVTPSTEAVVSTEAFDGGWLLQEPDGTPNCTMAFPIAKNNSSAAGLLTAGHCKGTGNYRRGGKRLQLPDGRFAVHH
ncbi:MAG: hypothetical protein QM606_08095 [Leucobacter sp.]